MDALAVETDIVREAFRNAFGGSEPQRIYRAPGRVNLIGEHTDYNLGFVCPIAIHLACFVAAGPSQTRTLRVYSQNMDEVREWPVDAIATLQPAKHWSDYVIGVAQQLIKLGITIQPLDLAIYSTVPVGSGLSSSASIEISSALALLFDRDIDRTELAKLAQRAEREFVGVPCGIMDQYVSVFGESQRAIKIDCRSITHETAQLPRDVSIIVVNSMVKHALGDSAYITRVRECAEAVEAIRRSQPQVTSLRDVSQRMLENAHRDMSETVFRRARHVVSEDERVEQFMAAAAEGDLMRMGRLFLASHRSLQHDYEVSADELDFLVDTAADFTGVCGARMTGGGFGGCTVNLVSPDRVDAFEGHVAEAYQRTFQRQVQIYRCEPAAGAGRVA
jgi:galactokinase